MIDRLSVRLAIGVAGFGLLLSIPSGFAQTSPDAGQTASGQDKLEEVVITARKLAENLQQIPVAVTAISGDELKEQSVKTISELQAHVPSLVIQEAADDPESALIMLRGREQTDATLALDPSVGVYLDGLYIPRTFGMQGSLLDTDRVEVLRGPQGTLYGRNTTGGAIAFYTNNPSTDKASGSIDVTGGNYDAWNVIGIGNLPINDHLAARFVFQRGKHDGYGHNAIGVGLESEDSQYYRAKLRATWADHWEAVVSGHYESDRSGGSINKLVGLVPDNFQGSGLPQGGAATQETELELFGAVDPQFDPQAIALLNSYVAKSSSNFYDTGGITYPSSYVWRADGGLTVDGDVSDYLHLRSITGYQHQQRDEFIESPIVVQALYGGEASRDEYYSEELQLLGGAQTRFKWVTGAYYGYEQGQDYIAVVTVPALSGGFFGVNSNSIRSTSGAVFAQGIWEFIPDWHLTGGARYSIDRRYMDATALVDPGNTCVVPAPGVEFTDGTVPGTFLCPRAFQKTFKKPSWLVSVDHQLTPDVLLYVKVAQGYRSGGWNESGTNFIESFAAFSPETNVEYETGVKSEFLDHRIRFNLAGYYDKYSDLQVTTAFVTNSGTFGSAVSNAATARIWGFEPELEILFPYGLSLQASGAYTNARYVHFLNINPDTLKPEDRSSLPFQSVPEATWNLSGRYMRPIAVGTVALELDFSWRSKINYDPTTVITSEVTQGPVGLLNGRLNLHVDTWNTDVALFGKNITGKKYYDQVIGGLEALGAYFSLAAAPTTYGIEVTKKFGE